MIPLTNLLPELAHPVDYCIGGVDYLQLCVGPPGDFRELKYFLDSAEYVRNWVVRVVIRLLYNVLPFQNLVWHKLTVVVLKMHKYTRHGVIGRMCGPVADIR